MEVLIAMVIISVCSSLAMVMYLNIQRSSRSFFKMKAVELCEFYMKETMDKKSYFEETWQAEEFTVKKAITAHEVFSDCAVIRIIVFDGVKKKIGELETVVMQN
jgi:hypothetical protein